MRYKKSDFNNGNFVIDVYSFLLQNLNPFMIDRKFDNENDIQRVKMLWQKCLPQQFTQYIFLYDNFLALTQMETTCQKANSVVKQVLTEHPSELNHLKHCLAENTKVIQYLYATLFAKHYSRNNKFGIQNKSLVDLAYREQIFNIKNKPQVANDPNNCNKPERNINEFEQVPIKKRVIAATTKILPADAKNYNKKKNIDTNKAKEQMELKQEKKRKNLENKKINLEKRLKPNNEEMEKIKYAEKKIASIL